MLTDRAGAPGEDGGRHATPARALLLACCCLLLPGCYLMQAATGEWGVLRARVPIQTVVASPDTPPTLRGELERVQAARSFASRELGLPDNRSYRTYADIHRPYVVWNVVAAPEFSLEPKRWCFPVAGCVAYRGYFHERRARQFAAALAVRGYDVVVEGVPAYSTLGRFADPVLSSMLPYGEDDVAATIFHELAHQLLYVKDDSRFNEAFATAVEEEGLTRWLTHQGAPRRIDRWRAQQAAAAELLAVLERTRARLALLYASPLAADAMRPRKAALLEQLAAGIRDLERRRGMHFEVYDAWIAQGLNNAELAAVATYYDCVPGFRRLLAAAHGELPQFYAAARRLAREPRVQRDAQLCGDASKEPPAGAVAPPE